MACCIWVLPQQRKNCFTSPQPLLLSSWTNIINYSFFPFVVCVSGSCHCQLEGDVHAGVRCPPFVEGEQGRCCKSFTVLFLKRCAWSETQLALSCRSRETQVQIPTVRKLTSKLCWERRYLTIFFEDKMEEGKTTLFYLELYEGMTG